MILTDPNDNSIDIYSESISDSLSKFIYNISFNFNLSEAGFYYLQFIKESYFFDQSFIYDSEFYTFVAGKVIETIDLSRSIYYSNLKISSKFKAEPGIYKVDNLKDDIYVYFYYDKDDNYNYNVFNIEAMETNPFEI